MSNRMSGGILPLFTNVNATPLWGSGGGGGGSVGNTLTLSTLTFGVGVDANANNILAQTGIVAIAQVGDSNQIQIGQQGSDSTIGNQYSVSASFGNGAGGDITFGDINGSSSALTAINYQANGFVSGNISTLIYGTTQIMPSGAPSGAGSQLLVSSILCSSINGAVPGGGGASNPNLALSTLTMNGGINMVNNTIKMDTIGQSAFYYNAGDNSTYLTGASTYTVAIGTQKFPFMLSVGDAGVTVQTNFSATGGTSLISSLTVSTINGGVYPPAGVPTASAVGLSNFVADTAYVPGGNNAYPLSQDFSITNGHTYRISQNFALGNTDATGYSAFAISGGGAGFPVFIKSYLNADLIPSLNGASGGLSTTFRANSSATAQVVAYNSSGSQSTIIQVQPDGAGGGIKWLLEDLGIVL